MFSVVSKKLVLSLSVLSFALGIFLIPALTLAADDLALAAGNGPAAYLERSQIIGTGNQIKVYRLPATDSKGKVRYWDVTLDLSLNSTTGKPIKASVISTSSPNVYSNEFIPGTYTGGSEGYYCGDVTCTITTSVLNGGRMEVALSCQDTNCGYTFSGSAVSGLIPGHPFELDLVAAGIDKITGYQQYSWGKVAYSYATWWSCIDTGDVISATQVGNTIVLSGYDKGNVQKCGITLVKQE